MDERRLSDEQLAGWREEPLPVHLTAMTFSKGPWRKETKEFARTLLPVWDAKKKRFMGTILDWSGDTGDELYNLFQAHLPHENGKTQNYIAVDHSARQLMNVVYRNRGRIPFRLIHGDGFNVPIQLARKGEKFGLVCYDTISEVRREWWETYGLAMREAVEEIEIAHGQKGRGFGILLNHVFERGNRPMWDRLQEHVEGILTTFNKWTPKRVDKWTLRESDLTKGYEAVKEPAFGGSTQGEFAGGFHVYRSEPKKEDGPRRLRMVTVRLAFDIRNRCINVYRRPAS